MFDDLPDTSLLLDFKNDLKTSAFAPAILESYEIGHDVAGLKFSISQVSNYHRAIHFFSHISEFLAILKFIRVDEHPIYDPIGEMVNPLRVVLHHCSNIAPRRFLVVLDHKTGDLLFQGCGLLWLRRDL